MASSADDDQLREIQGAWDHELRHCVGTRVRGSGVDIFWDLGGEVLYNQFQNGQNLTREVRRIAVQEELRPAVILTDKSTLRHFKTRTWYVAVLNFGHCTQQPLSRLAASAYLLRSSIAGSEAMLALNSAEATHNILATSDPQIRSVVTALMSVQEIDVVALAEVFDTIRGLVTHASKEAVHGLASVLEALTAANPESFDWFYEAIGKFKSGDRKLLLKKLLADAGGILDSGEIVADKTALRLEAVKAEALEFRKLVEDSTTSETDCQNYLSDGTHKWILGMGYAKVRPHPKAPTGVLDFLLERYDGLHDVLELKSPNDPIIDGTPVTLGQFSPPNKLSLSKGLSNAIAQALEYCRLMSDYENLMEEYGVKNSRYPRSIIVIGKRSSLSVQGYKMLEAINRSLHRVEIIPYDEIATRAEQLVANVERYMIRDCAIEATEGHIEPGPLVGE